MADDKSAAPAAAAAASAAVRPEVSSGSIDEVKALGGPIDPELQRTDNFPPLKNDLLLRAARGQYTERVPIWLHRQAGRYLPEYMAESKAAGDFFSMCRNPHRVKTVTLQPIDRFGLDAAIIFSDILVIPQALGLEVIMKPGVGPMLPAPVVDPTHMQRLRPSGSVDVQKALGYVFQAITLTRHALAGRVPLIGFAGAPWTIMCYVVEGGGPTKSYNKAKAWFYKYPKQSHELLQRITDVTVDYLLGQVRAGAQVLELFDSWAGDLSPFDFREFALPYLVQIARRVKDTLKAEGREVVPITAFAKGAHHSLELIAGAGVFDLISLEWTIDPAEARSRLDAAGLPLTLQGNLEPSALFAPEPELRSQARQLVDRFGTQRYVCNLGHGMLPYHSPDSVAVLVDEIHRYSEQCNAKAKAREAKKAGAAGAGAGAGAAATAAKDCVMSQRLGAAAVGAVVGAAVTAAALWFGFIRKPSASASAAK